MCQRWLFGDKNVNVTTAKSVERLKKLERDANKEITIKVFENVGHSLMTWKEFPPDGGYVRGYLDQIGSWVWNQVASN